MITNNHVKLTSCCVLTGIAGSSTSIPTTTAFQHHLFFSFEILTLAARAPVLTATLPQVSTYFNSLALMLWILTNTFWSVFNINWGMILIPLILVFQISDTATISTVVPSVGYCQQLAPPCKTPHWNSPCQKCNQVYMFHKTSRRDSQHVIV